MCSDGGDRFPGGWRQTPLPPQMWLFTLETFLQPSKDLHPFFPRAWCSSWAARNNGLQKTTVYIDSTYKDWLPSVMGLDPLPFPWHSPPPSSLFLLQVPTMNSNHRFPTQILYKPSTSSQSKLGPRWAQPIPFWCLSKSLLLYQLGPLSSFLFNIIQEVLVH